MLDSYPKTRPSTQSGITQSSNTTTKIAHWRSPYVIKPNQNGLVPQYRRCSTAFTKSSHYIFASCQTLWARKCSSTSQTRACIRSRKRRTILKHALFSYLDACPLMWRIRQSAAGNWLSSRQLCRLPRCITELNPNTNHILSIRGTKCFRYKSRCALPHAKPITYNPKFSRKNLGLDSTPATMPICNSGTINPASQNKPRLIYGYVY